MKIVIGNDHRGFKLKKSIIRKFWQKFKKYHFINVGSDSEERVDYPDYAEKVAEKVSQGKCRRGILICGSGVGVSIVANKFIGVRAALVWNKKLAKLSRLHNDSNVLCLAGDMSPEKAFGIIKIWLKISFKGGRHLVRVKKIKALEKRFYRK